MYSTCAVRLILLNLVNEKPLISLTGALHSSQAFLFSLTLLIKELSNLDWHILSVTDVTQRLSTSITRGLESAQVTRKIAEHGKNEHSPPPSHLFRRIFMYIFGGFGSLLLVSGILCCVAWKPLGEPVPQVSNLALGVVLFLVAALQAFFNAWQVLLTSNFKKAN